MLSTANDTDEETDEAPAPPALFVTETMAELHVRQGKVREAAALYRQLVAAAVGERQGRLRARLEELERRLRGSGGGVAGGCEARRAAPLVTAQGGLPAAGRAAPPVAPELVPAVSRAPAEGALVVTQAVRAGQIVHAQGRDLVVLAPVNPGGQVLADGHLHVYAPLRGVAVAGAAGRTDARLFCQRLEAQIVGVGTALLCADDVPVPLRGQAVQVWLEDGRCRVARL
jgi:septum site-determining protein MinC